MQLTGMLRALDLKRTRSFTRNQQRKKVTLLESFLIPCSLCGTVVDPVIHCLSVCLKSALAIKGERLYPKYGLYLPLLIYTIIFLFHLFLFMYLLA